MKRGITAAIAVALLSFPVFAGASFFFRAETTFPVLESEVSYRDDLGSASSFASVSVDRGGWISQGEKPFHPNGTSIHVWARFDIPPMPKARQVLLRSGPWENVEYFIVRDGRLVDRQKVGTLVPMSERTTRVSMTPSSFHSGFVALDLPPQSSTTVYARLATDGRYISIKRIRFSLWNTKQVMEGELQDRWLEGLFFGVMLVLVIYNLALFLLNRRETSYFYYVIVLISGSLSQGLLFGLTSEFLWPNQPNGDYFAMWIALPVSMWAAAQFVRRYLDTGTRYSRSDAWLKWFGYLALLSLPVYFLQFVIGHAASVMQTTLETVVFSSFIFIGIIGVTIAALRDGHSLARLFLTAVLCSVVGTLITFGAWFDFLPEAEWALNASQVGAALTGILMSIGLGFRMRQLHRQLADRQIEEARLRTDYERQKREMVEEQSSRLEAKVIERTAELAATKEKSDALLANILPQAVIDELKAKGQSDPRRHEEVSILFTDFSGFTQAVSSIPPKRLVQELDEIFRGFDDIVSRNGLEKIKTIGDAYMAASGLPVACADHAARCVRAGLEMTNFIAERNQSAAIKWGLRVGVHSGTVVAGIVGKNKYAYDVWGDTVNIASRLESAGEAGRVNVSAYTYDLIRNDFDCEYRGKVDAKGKGQIDMYFVAGAHIP